VNVQVLTDSAVVARKAEKFIAAEALTAVSLRGCFAVAISGGRKALVLPENAEAGNTKPE
jgi:hypothetical protein